MGGYEIINLNLLITGFMGGFFRISMEPNPPTPWKLVRYVILGGFASNFFVPLLLIIVVAVPQLLTKIQFPEAAIKFVPWSVAFLIGMGGLRIGQWADRQLAKWLKHIERMRNE
jgi:flagellar biosynthesis protein FliQ